MSYVEAVNALALRPTHGILLKLPPEHVAERVQGRDVRRTFEERADYLADVQEEMIRRWPADFLLVDATDPVEEVAAQIYRYVTS
jgi:thymidylate kinase